MGRTTQRGHHEPVTIFDVAAHAQVSAATVTRHMRGARVRRADQVQQAIDELGFRPNAAAQALRSGRTRTVAVVVPDITNPFFAAVVHGAEQVARGQDLMLALINTGEDADREAATLHELAGRVDGLLLAPTSERTSRADRGLAAVRAAGLPVVLLDRETDVPGAGTAPDSTPGSTLDTVLDTVLDIVLVDNAGGARLAAAHLLDLGHRRVATVHGPLTSTPGRLRLDGFVAELAERGIAVDGDGVEPGDFTAAGGYAAVRRLLDRHPPGSPRRPSAVFVANNLMTLGALQALRDLTVPVPDALSVVGFDDHPAASLLTPALTVVDRPMHEQGETAMRLLLDRIVGLRAGRGERVVLPTRLVVRGSTAPPAGPGSLNPLHQKETHVPPSCRL